MGHIYAARAVLPTMLERGSGYLVQTASAAGLLTQLGSAPYAVTKHAAIAFAEYLAITYGAEEYGSQYWRLKRSEPRSSQVRTPACSRRLRWMGSWNLTMSHASRSKASLTNDS